MNVIISETSKELGVAAGRAAGQLIREALAEKGTATIILATGTSQFETLNQLVGEEGIDWSKVTMFHLDEYIGLPETHPASFRKYLKERFLTRVPALKAAFLINGEAPPEEETARLGALIGAETVDVALVGIGENGHLAFNDPPADFETRKPYLVVTLDEACRRQQLGEGWFETLEAVPTQAVSMSIQQILKSRHIVCSVPDERKAQAVKNCLELPIGPDFPAGILREHPSCTLYLDRPAAGLLAEGADRAEFTR
ncbi:glucosamine-6-phosphate deaminase [Larkinella soli]|uniref:glucosamine-6-phosphate deaminase n=1 Tax=Larkinella soli TaxID=1770527 RepID=UPI000FFBE538|nr:glucosamine-6-phosphate deaminase [Larkinella soli]